MDDFPANVIKDIAEMELNAKILTSVRKVALLVTKIKNVKIHLDHMNAFVKMVS